MKTVGNVAGLGERHVEKMVNVRVAFIDGKWLKGSLWCPLIAAHEPLSVFGAK